MSEKQTIEAGNSLTTPLGSVCDCQNWADLDLRVRLDAAFRLLKELTRGIDCWKPYRKAKALEGVFLPKEPE